MARVIGWVVGLFLLVVVVGIGGIAVSSGDDGSEVATISGYTATFDVDKDGGMRVVEDIAVDFPVSRHGIFRFFDTWDAGDAHNRAIPRDIQVTRNGNSEPFELQNDQRGRYRVVKIGSADVTVSGQQQYRISYRIEGVLTPGADGSRTQFYWDLVPAGWAMPIRSAELTVHLPAEAQDVRCAVGAGSTSGCTATGEGTRTLTVEADALSPHTPVTIRAGLDIATPPADTLPWPSRLDPVLGRHPVLLGLVLLGALAAAGAGARLSRSVRERKPQFPVMYAPPEGIGPAQASYILTEQIKDSAFVASMMYAAERGALTLEQSGGDWTIAGIGDGGAWQRIDPVTQETAKALGVWGQGTAFTASRASVSSGQTLKTVLAGFKENTKTWARISGLMVSSGLGPFGGFVLVALTALTVWLGAFNPLNMSVVALIPGLFLIFGLGIGASGAGTKRTPAGRDLWSRVGGFKRILSTPSAEDRFDFSGRKELYTAYIPWAVAFGCADEWARKYRVETGEEPPAPSYLVGGYTGAHTAALVDQMVTSFDSAVSSAISAYQATQSSSSSGGGGGFSGGGGGGGGGGGSW